MIDAIVRGTLGEIGSVILDFYIQNALWINGILLLYVLILVLAKRGYSKIIQAIKRELIDQFGEEVFRKNEKNFTKAMERLQLNWDIIAKQTWMPIISFNNSLFFRIKSPTFLQKHFTSNKVYSLFKIKGT